MAVATAAVAGLLALAATVATLATAVAAATTLLVAATAVALLSTSGAVASDVADLTALDYWGYCQRKGDFLNARVGRGRRW